MKPRDWVGDIGFVLVVVCTVVLTVTTVRRPSGRGDNPSTPVRLPDEMWRSAMSHGHVRGDDSAPVTVVVFSDFECPACRSLATVVLPRIDSLHPGRVRVLYRHWPLSSHPMAYAAARASECAAVQGRFYELHDVLFAQQRALGIVPLEQMARQAGVPDTAAFDECVQRTEAVPSVDRDAALAEVLGAKGTPAVAVNGMFFRAGIDWLVLDSLVRVSR